MNIVFITIIVALIVAFLVALYLDTQYKQPNIKFDSEMDIATWLKLECGGLSKDYWNNEIMFDKKCDEIRGKYISWKMFCGWIVVLFIFLIYSQETLDDFHKILRYDHIDKDAYLLYAKICTWLSLVALIAFVLYCLSQTTMKINNKDEYIWDGVVFAVVLTLMTITLITNVLLLKLLVAPPIGAFDIMAFYIKRSIGIYNLWQTIVIFFEALIVIIMRWINKKTLTINIVQNKMHEYYQKQKRL